MKNNNPFLKIILLAPLILFAVSCKNKCTDEAGTEPIDINAADACTLTCAGERTLELVTHTLGVSDARSERGLFHMEVVATSSNITIDTLADNVAYSQLCILKGYADNIPSSCITASTITGLRIAFGLEQDFKHIKLIYEPIKLCLINASTVSPCHGTFVITGSYGKLYSYNECKDQFEELQVSTAIADTMRYMRNIRIEHTYGGNYQPFSTNLSNGDLSDVKSVVFSFQEIKTLYDQNSPHPDHISFWNSLTEQNFSGTYRRKHSVFMGPQALGLREEESVFVFSGPYTGKYANLAHLCPPHCSNLIFSLCK